MKIKRCIYEQLIGLPCVPPEMGGILGGKDGVIDKIILDEEESYHEGIYVPNTSFLNKCIQRWNCENIIFLGMFHTHALNWPELSTEDKRYILQITYAMPGHVNKLYFPLIFPLNGMKAFYAQRIDKEVFIVEDEIQIV